MESALNAALARRLTRATGHPWMPDWPGIARLGELIATPAGGGRVFIVLRGDVVYVGVPERTRPTAARMARRLRDHAARGALIAELDLGDWLHTWRRRVARRRRLAPAIARSRNDRLRRQKARRVVWSAAPVAVEFQLVMPGVPHPPDVEACSTCGVAFHRRPPECPACKRGHRAQ